MKLSKHLLTFLTLLLLSLASIHCGSSTSSGSSSTPPVDIPSPVSHLSISTPDSNGEVTVTGDAGFADGSTLVTVLNASQTARLFTDLFISVAHAGTSSTVTSNADGSFQTTISASAGDSLTVSYTNGGTATSVSDSVPQKRFLVSTSVTLKDISMDPTTNQVMIVGNDGTDGFVFVVDAGSGSVNQTITLSGASGADRISTDPTTGDSLVIDSTNDVAWVVDLSAGSATGEDVLSPFDVAFLESGTHALISHDTTVVVSNYNTATTTADSVGTPVGDNDAATSSASFVDTDNDGTDDVFALLTLMDDDANHVVTMSVEEDDSLTQETDTIVETGDTISGMAFFNAGTEVLISDSENDQILRVNLTTDETTTISVGDNPIGVVVNDSDEKAYVVNRGDRTVTEIDLTDNSTSLNSAPLGLSPTQITTKRATSGASIIILNTGDGTIEVISTS